MKKVKLVSWFLLALGGIALGFSIVFTYSILAFVGLGLTFWGALMLYLTTEEYVKKSLLDSTMTSSLADLNQILTELEYEGKAIYLPPEYLKEFETTKIYIPKNKNSNLPTPEEIQQQDDQIFLKNPKAALISPPGLSLSKLFEETLGTSFTKVNLESLQQKLPKLFIEHLEIAENLELQTRYGTINKRISNSRSLVQTENSAIHVKITNSIYKNACKEALKLSHIKDSIGCAICSAIACALAKAVGKPIIIEGIQTFEDGKVIEATYRVLETIE